MLIRSQDKTVLIDTTGTTIKICNGYREDIEIVANGNSQSAYFYETLGFYNNKERAIEVLDSIQNEFELCRSAVFQMPEE